MTVYVLDMTADPRDWDEILTRGLWYRPSKNEPVARAWAEAVAARIPGLAAMVVQWRGIPHLREARGRGLPPTNRLLPAALRGRPFVVQTEGHTPYYYSPVVRPEWPELFRAVARARGDFP